MEIKLNFVTSSNFDKVQPFWLHFGKKCLHVFFAWSLSPIHARLISTLSWVGSHMQINVPRHWFDRNVCAVCYYVSFYFVFFLIAFVFSPFFYWWNKCHVNYGPKNGVKDDDKKEEKVKSSSSNKYQQIK